MSRTSFAAEMRRIERERIRAIKENEREVARQAKEDAKAYAESRAEQAESATAEVKGREEAIQNLLINASIAHRAFDFEKSKKPLDRTDFDFGQTPLIKPQISDYDLPSPSWLDRIIPGSAGRQKRRQAAAQARYEQAMGDYEVEDTGRQRERALFRAHQQRSNQEVERYNKEIDELCAGLKKGDHASIVRFYSKMCNEDLAEEFDALSAEIGYSETSRHLVIDLELPDIGAIPEAAGFKYIKSVDRIDTIYRPTAKRKAMYSNLISQISLKCLSRIFTCHDMDNLNCATLNAMLDGIDPSTGNNVRACLVSVSITPDNFRQLNLRQVQPEQCLKSLKASVSRAPAEMSPVKPLVELDMVDPRFVATSDIMSNLDGRPNLMDLTPNQFEGLITNLFASMGLETRQTRASRDGGVDCVAFDQRPIFGGKVVIQAKRYRGTVGVSAVRDLFGTVQNEGASKGILVTTSGYGKASFDFARGKPLELLDGGNLLHLLMEHAKIDAKIIMPDDWKDSHIHVD